MIGPVPTTGRAVVPATPGTANAATRAVAKTPAVTMPVVMIGAAMMPVVTTASGTADRVPDPGRAADATTTGRAGRGRTAGAHPARAIGPSTVTGPVRAIGPSTVTGLVRAIGLSTVTGLVRAIGLSTVTGPVRATGPSTVTGPVRATGPSTVTGLVRAIGLSTVTGLVPATGPSPATSRVSVTVPATGIGPSTATSPAMTTGRAGTGRGVTVDPAEMRDRVGMRDPVEPDRRDRGVRGRDGAGRDRAGRDGVGSGGAGRGAPGRSGGSGFERGSRYSGAPREGVGAPRAEYRRRTDDPYRADTRPEDRGDGRRVREAEGPPLPEDLDPRRLDGEVRGQLRSLARPVAEQVSLRLIAAGELIDVEPETALAHALVARRLASRMAAVREAVGLAAYRAGQWQTAIGELRAYHRMTGRQTHLAMLADCERALGRPERAIDMFRAADREQLSPDEAMELLIVAAGARVDLGQRDAAVAMLQVRELTSDEPWVARLRYAYADALLARRAGGMRRGSGSPARPRWTRTRSPTRRSACSTSTAS